MKNLRKIRLERDMTQEELGSSINKNKSTIHYYEKGVSDCGVKNMLILCKVLNTNPNHLLGFTSKDK